MDNNVYPEYEEKYEKIVKDKIAELFEGSGARIYLFGSRMKGLTKRGSDLDIGIENIDYQDFLIKKRQFRLFLEESIVPFKVDLVLFDTANQDFVKSVKKEAVLWITE